MQKRRAFSVLELLVAMALLALLGGFTVLNMRSAGSGADSRSLATLVAEHLRNARETSVASQQPVAVVFPTDLASKAFSQSLYLASGLSKAHVSRVFPFEREHRAAALFVGSWGAGLNTPPAVGFNVDQWLDPAMRKDFALVFTPEGGVTSNGFPFCDGAYQLVACAGGTASPATPYFQATQLGRPWRIAVSPSGQVQLKEGLSGTSSGVESRQGLAVTATATPPTAPPLPACAPTSVGVTVMPTPSPDRPAGIDTTVVAGQRLTLGLNASDVSGRDLYVQWTCTPVSGTAGPGHFSFPGKQKMTWDAANQRWTSCWDWIAPLTAQPGDKFRFQASLGDGLTALVVPQADQQILAIPNDQIYGTLTTGRVIRCNRDGTNRVTVANVSTSNRGVDACPDGSKILSAGPTGWTIYSGDNGMVVASASPAGFIESPPALSPVGNRVAYWQNAGSPSRICLCNPDGTGVSPTIANNLIPAGFPGGQTLRWSPDQTKLAFVAALPSNLESLWILDLTSNTLTDTNPGTSVNGLQWARDSSFVYYQAGLTLQRYSLAAAAVDPSWAGFSGVPGFPFAVSGDGQDILYRAGNFLRSQPIAASSSVQVGDNPFGVGVYSISIAKR